MALDDGTTVMPTGRGWSRSPSALLLRHVYGTLNRVANAKLEIEQAAAPGEGQGSIDDSASLISHPGVDDDSAGSINTSNDQMSWQLNVAHFRKRLANVMKANHNRQAPNIIWATVPSKQLQHVGFCTVLDLKEHPSGLAGAMPSSIDHSNRGSVRNSQSRPLVSPTGSSRIYLEEIDAMPFTKDNTHEFLFGFSSQTKISVLMLLTYRIHLHFLLRWNFDDSITRTQLDSLIKNQLIAPNFLFSNFWCEEDKCTTFIKNVSKTAFPTRSILKAAEEAKTSGQPFSVHDIFTKKTKNISRDMLGSPKWTAFKTFMLPLTPELLSAILSKQGRPGNLTELERNTVEHFSFVQRENIGALDELVSTTSNRGFNTALNAVLKEGVLSDRFLQRMAMVYAGFWNIYHPYLKEVQELKRDTQRDQQTLLHCKAKVYRFLALVRQDQTAVSVEKKVTLDNLVSTQEVLDYLKNHEAGIDHEIRKYLDIQIQIN